MALISAPISFESCYRNLMSLNRSKLQTNLFVAGVVRASCSFVMNRLLLLSSLLHVIRLRTARPETKLSNGQNFGSVFHIGNVMPETGASFGTEMTFLPKGSRGFLRGFRFNFIDLND